MACPLFRSSLNSAGLLIHTGHPHSSPDVVRYENHLTCENVDSDRLRIFGSFTHGRRTDTIPDRVIRSGIPGRLAL